MDIIVVVGKDEHWDAFIRDLKQIWILDRISHRYAVLGKIQYIRIDMKDPEKMNGMRVDKALFYNCVPDIPFEYRLATRLRSGSVEGNIETIWN